MTTLFNQLTEPAQYADPSIPTGFDASIGYILGQCCGLTYDQYGSYPTPLPTSGTLADGATTYTMIGDPIIVSESIGTGSIVGQDGGYRSVPIGFAMKCTVSDGTAFNVIALRGTRTWTEWLQDAEAVPTGFLVGNNGDQGYSELFGIVSSLGHVHGGFYSLYTTGTDGAVPVQSPGPKKDTYQYSRPDGSIAAQISTIVSNGGWDASLSLYVTGHSLGAALAVLCAMDIGTNFTSSFAASGLNMWNLAGPMVAAGLSVDGVSVLGSPSDIVTNYAQAISSSWRIVNAADIVPIMPPSISVSLVTVSFEHVTTTNVTFCAQTGSIGGNHSSTGVYIPYLQQLADSFSGS